MMSTNALLATGDIICHRLIDVVIGYTDFLCFCSYMHSLCNQTYGTTSRSDQQTIVRVLWDIENIPVSHSLGAVGTVNAIQTFLESIELYKGGVDLAITVFGNLSRIGKHIVDLDKAGVEIVTYTST